MSFFVGNAKLKNGTVDNTVIGGSTPADGSFNTLTANTELVVADITGAASSNLEIDANGNLYIESTDTITIGGDDVDKNINIGTGGTRTVNIGSTTTDQDTTIAVASKSIDIITDDDSADAILLRADGGDSSSIKIHANDGKSESSINLVSDEGGITATATLGNISLDAADILSLTGPTITLNADDNGTVNIDNDTDASTINIGNTGGVKTINVGSSSGTLGVQVSKLDMKISGAADNSISLAANTTINVANKDLNLNSGTGNITIASTGTSTDAIKLNASGIAGGITASAGSGNIELSAAYDSSFKVNGDGKTLTLDASGGNANQVIISSHGTGANAIHLDGNIAGAGGIDIDAGTSGVDIDTTGAIALDTTGAIQIGVNTQATGIYIGTHEDAPTVTIGEATISKNLTVTGNLLVSGNTVTQNVETMVIEDPIIGLRRGENAPTEDGDGGFIIEQATGSKHKAFIWDNSGNGGVGCFTMIDTTTTASGGNGSSINDSGTLDLTISGLIAEGNTVGTGYLSIGGATQLEGAITAAGAISATAGGTGLDVSNDATIGGDLTVNGGDLLATNAAATLNLFKETSGKTTLPVGDIDMGATNKIGREYGN